ncbi:MAG: hypothetical protein SF182_11275 [Deltaproteobacteria bacterium]|nr:hypothetical protein [Deltaproteobacteria bacterium]
MLELTLDLLLVALGVVLMAYPEGSAKVLAELSRAEQSAWQDYPIEDFLLRPRIVLIIGAGSAISGVLLLLGLIAR